MLNLKDPWIFYKNKLRLTLEVKKNQTHKKNLTKSIQKHIYSKNNDLLLKFIKILYV